MESEQHNSESPRIHDVLIIGAGPCGLAVASRMREATPSSLFTDIEHQRYHWLRSQKGRVPVLKTRGRAQQKVLIEEDSSSTHSANTEQSEYSLLVLDSTSSTYLGKWRKLFSALEIKTLRSPLFFHVDPQDRDGLKEYAYANGRIGEMVEIKGVVGKEKSKHQVKKERSKKPSKQVHSGKSIDERDKQDYFTPSAQLFEDYCQKCVDKYHLENFVQQSDVQSLSWAPEGLNDIPNRCWIAKTTTRTYLTRVVVLATGPGIPTPIPISSQEREGACHSSQVPLLGPVPEHVRLKMKTKEATYAIVVGGGLTSAQIADLCVRKGYTKVFILMRSNLKTKHFDLELEWVAKYRNLQLAYFWGTADPATRSEIIKSARNGGSITPTYIKVLEQHQAHGKLSMYTRTTIVDKIWDADTKTWDVKTEPLIPDLPKIDFIFFATGAVADYEKSPLLQQLQNTNPIRFQDGLPCVTEDLQWNSDVPLFFTGRSAALQLGPGAANLEGARMGAERIVPRIQEILEGLADNQKADGDNKMKSLRERYALGTTHLNMYTALAGSDGSEDEK
ncbi:FAD binding domain protein [Xylogone sp. PMI_703]|nr:FAD binding domain protein [Xylogone sp. PMI_703]